MKGGKINKLMGVGLLVLLLASTPFIGGCAPAEVTPGPGTEVTPAPPEVIELKLAHWTSTTSAWQAQYEAFKKEVEEKTNGKVHITIIPGGALGKPVTHYELLRGGTVDLSMFIPIYFPGAYPLMDAFALPFLCTGDISTHYQVAQKLIKEGLVDRKLYDEVHFVATGGYPGQHLYTTEKKVTKPEDVKGMLLGSAGGIRTDFLECLGARVEFISFVDTYTALQRGVVKGVVFDYESGRDIKLEEVTRYVCELDTMPGQILLVMNKERYESLPEDIQKVIDEAGDHCVAVFCKEAMEGAEHGKALLEEAGVEIYRPTESELGDWIDAVGPVFENYINDMDAKGLPARILLARYEEEVERLGGKVSLPYKF